MRLIFNYPITGTQSIVDAGDKDRRQLRRFVRLTRRAIRKLQVKNPAMPTFVRVRFR